MAKKIEYQKSVTNDQLAIIICREALPQKLPAYSQKEVYFTQSKYNLLSYQNYRKNASEYYFEIKEVEEFKSLSKLESY